MPKKKKMEKVLQNNNIDPQKSYCITTDNEVLNNVGLGVFSIEKLREWGSHANNLSMLAGINIHELLKPEDGIFEFHYWRTKERSGEYKHFNQEINSSMGWVYNTYNASTLSLNPNELVIQQIIDKNIEINKKLISYPDLSTNWTQKQLAWLEFIRDIKSSKYRCLEWCPKGGGKCRLYLYDNKLKNTYDRSVTIRDLKFVDHKSDSTGRLYTKKEDGELVEVSKSYIPTEYVAANLSMYYNEFLGKWESGTPQCLAVLTTDIESADTVDITEIINNKTVELLDPLNGQGVKTGSGIPIRMQNANPLQWSPEYSTYKQINDERIKNGGTAILDKQAVKIYNMSKRPWSSGEMVILNKIDGVWIPLSFGVEEAPATVIEPQNGEWEFYNLSATVESYFRSSAGEQFRYDEYEEAFHRAYYFNDPLNKDLYSTAKVSYVDVKDTFVQFTSWDFLGPKLGGLRKHNGIATTQFTEKANGKPLGENGDGKFVQGVHSSNFFGCVFPDGYDTQGKYEEYMTTQHPVLKGYGDKHDEFFVGIADSVKVFESDSDANADLDAGPMLTDSNLRHLPADIATNASTSGVNGRPLRAIMTFPIESASLYEDVRNKMANGHMDNWIYRGNDIYDSMFDFKPKNPSRIQFRPLKTETYATFEHMTHVDAINAPNDARGVFGAKSWGFVNSNTSPLATKVKDRLDDPHPGLGNNGLRYANDIVVDLRSDNSKFPEPYWDRWSDGRPAGVVGIIGAVSTATASSSIRFNADCFLGMKSFFINGDFYPSWGGNGGNGPHNMNTTMLYARIYHHWDRNLTVYDPRFFAVHHFNPGFDNMNAAYGEISVDLIIPKGSAGLLVDGAIVDHNFNVLPKDQWHTDKRRRGKLLPYKYEYLTIGVNNDKILSAGSGYSSKDEFTTSGGSGANVLANPIVDGTGAITGFILVDCGDGFAVEDFSIDPVVNPDSKVRIVPLNVTGTGFDGRFSTGQVITKEGEDKKPKVATTDEYLQLTPNPPLGNNGAVVNELDELRSVEAQLSNKSSDNKYDIFFHFHNDISHTFANSWSTPNAFEQAVTLEVIPL